jgi:formate hydrogenlyase transcriptional activator
MAALVNFVPTVGPHPTSEVKKELIGSSRSMQHVLEAVQTVAPTDCAVLIMGETGTGKELVARAVHEKSLRHHGPYVKLNCAAIPSGLLESELFGHERGAFTGAFNQTMGRFQRAHQGTLFLDEIGDMPMEMQPKLLRVLQEQEFERLGSSRTIRVDVRVVAATNQNLAQLVRENRFRADLFYRLNVFPIAIPSLRERREDIPMLVRHFVQKLASRLDKRIEHIPEETMELLQSHDWPGNIRELENFVERAVIMSPGTVLRPQFGEYQRVAKAEAPLINRTLAEAERDHILETLRQVGWVVGGRSGAAAQLGLPRTTLMYRMRKLGIAQAQTQTAAFA